jgi:hypothetical protein
MTEHETLHILQYNVWKSRDVVLASLFQDRRILDYDILAIQEPWRNPYIATSYHPLKAHFQLSYQNDENTRVCLYINKRIDASTWNVSFISKDIIAVEVIHPTRQHKISIFNVYNEVGSSTLADLTEAMARLGPHHETLVLGDFNLHHPLWSSIHNPASHGIAASQALLAIIEEFQLRLLTVPGTITHRWNGGDSTIDLTFPSPRPSHGTGDRPSCTGNWSGAKPTNRYSDRPSWRTFLEIQTPSR